MAGLSGGSPNYDMVIRRYNSDGNIDTTFAGVGYVTHNNAAGGNANDIGWSVALDAAGRILVCGISKSGAGNWYDNVIWRYNP